MGGRKPVPTHLRVIRGNPGRRPLPKHEPRPDADLSESPAYLSERQRRAWTYAIANSVPGLLKRNDVGTLAGYIIAQETVAECNERLADSGLVITSSTKAGPISVGSPYERIRRQNIALMVKLASELGFTPASRTRIEIIPDVTQDDEWDEILNG